LKSVRTINTKIVNLALIVNSILIVKVRSKNESLKRRITQKIT